MLAVYRREIRSYMHTMTGPMLMAFVLAFEGVLCTVYNIRGGYSNFEYTFDGMGFCYLLVVPLLTMNVWAGERRQRTEPLLLSSPVSISQLLLGKYLALTSLLLSAVLISCLYPPLFSFYGKVNFVATYSAIAAFYFLGCTLLSIGLFISTLTDKPLLAAFICFGVLLIVYLMSSIRAAVPASKAVSVIVLCAVSMLAVLAVRFAIGSWKLATVIGVVCAAALLLVFALRPLKLSEALLSLLKAFDLFSNQAVFTNGLFDLGIIIRFISIAICFFACSVFSVEKRRWS